MTKKKASTQLPDDDQRRLIAEDLDTTMLVEAAAGTGKTTGMIQRMVALLKEGRCPVETLAAVTFTRKAAAELRARLRVAVEKAAPSASGHAAVRLAQAAGNLDRCFTGTIHSFCARLLRERPVEAGVDVAFEEIEDEADFVLRSEAWELYVASLHADGDPLLEELERLGLGVGRLGNAFATYADYPDVDEWPEGEVPALDAKGAADGLMEYHKHILALLPGLPLDAGNDTLIPRYRRLARLMAHLDQDQPAELAEVLGEVGKQKVIQKMWPGGKRQALAELARWDRFRDEVAEPFVAKWLARRYGPVMRALAGAKEAYDRLRRSRGALNFQDLLMRAAALLKNKPHVRRYFRERFTHLLVDEFQDTDPVQAEVMLLITSDDPDEADWRACRPAPGSLFVVGDPKQSIYRFRRADIATYNRVKGIIVERGGRVVSLSSNFRTLRPVVEWVNDVFAGAFPASADEFSPGYVSLDAVRQGRAGDTAGVMELRVPAEYRNKDTVAAYDADFIARFIRKALDEGMTVPHTPQEHDAGVGPRAAPGDFMVLTWAKARLGVYARALSQLGVPHQVTGGSALNEVPEVGSLHVCLRAVTRPHDPVALVAALRGELFGIDDAALYEFKRAGGEFRFETAVPAALAPERAGAFEDAFARLRKYASWLRRLPAVAALERIVGDLGLAVSALASPGGDFRAGSLMKALALVRSAQAGTWSAAELVDHLGRLVEQEETHDGLGVRPARGSVVRVMNLHKAKGLEAPVVFLADPSGAGDHEPVLHVDRSGERLRGYLAVHGEKSEHSHGKAPLLARPPGWDELAEREKRFLDAEKTRLLYVAATRAGSLLVVSRRESDDRWSCWRFFERHLEGCQRLADPGKVAAPAMESAPVGPAEPAEAREDIRRRWTEALRPTCARHAAKAVSVGATEYADAAGEHGTEWGEVVHALLQVAMADPGADVERLAESVLAEHGIPRGRAAEAARTVRAVTASDLWRRASASPVRLAEVPFEMPEPAAEGVAPAVLRGVVDLAFLEDDRWVVVDYKTDAAARTALGELVERYRGQVRLYGDALARITGREVRETGLYFVSCGEYVRAD